MIISNCFINSNISEYVVFIGLRSHLIKDYEVFQYKVFARVGFANHCLKCSKRRWVKKQQPKQ